MPDGAQNLSLHAPGQDQPQFGFLDTDRARLAEAGAEHLEKIDRTAQWLAYLVTVGFFSLLFLLCFKKAPDANLAMMNIILGSLGTAWVGVMAYYFGSTQAGRTKDWMLYQSQPVPATRKSE